MPITDQVRRKNDRLHRPLVVAAVLFYLLVYAYLFTHVFEVLHVPAPRSVAQRLGIASPQVFDNDGNVDSNLVIVFGQLFRTNDDERLVYYVVIAAAFLSVYFLPLAYKQPAMVSWTCVGLFALFGLKATAGLLFGHLVVYLVLHPVRSGRTWLSGFAGILGFLAFQQRDIAGLLLVLLMSVSAVFSVFCYRLILLPLLERPRIGKTMRALVVQSAMVTVFFFAFREWYTNREWTLPIGLILFFWQWMRVIMYHIDYKDGLVPSDISFWKYLAVFFSPGVIANWHWGVTIGQGYAYTQNNFLCEEKNKLVFDGLKLWSIALCYLVLGDWIVLQLVEVFSGWGVPVHRATTAYLVRDYVAGEPVSTVGVLSTTMADLCRWLLRWGGVVHFKVGVWRILGYRFDPYYNRPWLATNLATFWSRYAFHYREFLVRAFYYPVFFGHLKRHKYLRVFVATMAAACLGNLVWGHVGERLIYKGMTTDSIAHVLGTWPYFFFLGLGIALSQIYLLRRKRSRKPWTGGPWVLADVLCAYGTLQFYALVKIFARPCADGTIADQFRLVLIGLGIDFLA